MLSKSPLCKTYAFWLVCLLTATLLTQCKKDPVAKPIPENAGTVVYAYTSGYIAKNTPIRVRFTNSAVTNEQIGSTVAAKVIQFRPAISGNAVWEDDRTILFQPAEYLPSNTKYVGVVKLKSIFNEVPKELQSFEFEFKTKAQNFTVNLGGLQQQGADPAKQQYYGTIYTSDIAKPELVEKVLSAKQNGKALPIRWEHDPDLANHRFFIESIVRGEQEGKVQIEWNGKPLSVKKKEMTTIIVPSLSDFQVMDAQVVQQEEQFVLLHFSDQLEPTQDLKGLVSIENYTKSFRFNIDGNQLRIYPAGRIAGEHKVRIESGLRNNRGNAMKHPSEWTLSFEDMKPQLRLTGKGVILPESEGLLFPFEAVNLRAVDVEVFKIYSNNILQFLQANQLDGGYDMERVGRIIRQQRVALKDLDPQADAAKWTRYALDLNQLIAEDRNAIYQIRLGFKPAYSEYYCGSDTEKEDDLKVIEDPFDQEGEIKSIMNVGYYGPNGYYDGYRWEHRENPCYPAYYNSNRVVRRNVFASNIGLIAKAGTNGKLMIAATDIRTTQPRGGLELQVYDYQQQLMSTLVTDEFGMAAVELQRKPFLVVAKKNNEKGFLRLLDPNSLSLSKFDVSGAVAQKGLKGYIYGERGVWRPGDSLYLNFVLEDESKRLPANHPINIELYDARNQLQQKTASSRNVNNVYPIPFHTMADAPTGNWRVVVKVGGATFTKNLMVETVKPNRLKIKLDFENEQLVAEDMPMSIPLQVNWLHGAPGRNLKARSEIQLRAQNTTFPKYKTYEFDDPARKYNAQGQKIFDRSVDAQGKAAIQLDLSKNKAQMPGKMRVDFRTRAFEKGGDFSEDNYSIAYYPFETYAGISIPVNRYGSKRLDINKDGKIDIVLVDKDGQPQANRQLNVGLYRVNWRWWWESDNSNIRNFNSSTHFNAQDSARVTTNSNGEGSWSLTVPQWGRYMVRVCDEVSGHCAGDFFYAGYPWYGSSANANHREAAAMLVFSADKEKYNVGEKVNLRIPSSEEGRALISIENGSDVIETYWKELEKGETNFEFFTTPEMAPTVYAHVTLLQPHAQVQNDLPVRMYGVIPVHVEDPDTRLAPQLNMPEVLEPKQQVNIEVSEKNGKAMAYTIAMVDEGLLDLTRFKTPNPWDAFYAREALGVKTWDVFDHVLGAFGKQIGRVLSIGGDGDLKKPESGKQANRFEPVVRSLGPFYLEKGKTKKHTITLPNYVGSVRTMVVASNKGAYGSADKTTPVRKPLMVLATLPRVLGPGEKLKLPIDVFAMESKVKNVTLKLEEESGLVEIIGPANQKISFDQPGDQLVEFDIQIREQVGIAKFVVSASGAGEQASQEIEIAVRNPNPYVTDITSDIVEAGNSWTQEVIPIGVKGTNTATLEVSNIPPLNLEDRLQYLIRYPHGCIEQTTSAAFPQLFVSNLTELDQKQKGSIADNIKAAINKFKNFQNSGGGFGYWPGNYSADDWSTSYVGHFLLEAKNQGYAIPETMLSRWKNYQKNRARRWTSSNETNQYYHRGNHELQQAYRLYTLAMAKEAELGAMNRLREQPNLSNIAAHKLAAAYALAGKTEVARQLLNNSSTTVEDYQELSYTYGSGLRDRAIILETLVLMKDKVQSTEMARAISDELSSQRWYGTQTVSYALLAMSKYISNTQLDEQLKFAYQLGNGQRVNAGSDKPILLIDVPVDKIAGQQIQLSNSSNGLLFIRWIVNGQPVVGDQTAAANNLQLNIAYKTIDGKDLDPTRIPQGTDFIAEVKIKNPGKRSYWYHEMALSQVFPSGWEILNTRLSNVQQFKNTDTPEYQDIRDDRVYSYFDIRQGKDKTFRVQLNAAYQGRYYMPSVSCEAMYDNTINARQPGSWIEVVKGEVEL